MGVERDSSAGDAEEGAPLVAGGRRAAAAAAARLAAATRRSGPARVLLATAVALAWMFVSSLLIIVNKIILKDLGFGYPMCVSGMGMASSGVLSFLLCRVARLVEARAPVTPRVWVRGVLPVGFFMAATLWAGNLVYLHLSVSFIQMLKAFTPVITMAALFVARLETPTYKMVFSVLGIALGTALAAYGEIRNSLVGLAIMMTSEVCEAIRLVMTQLLLAGLSMNPFEGVMWLAPACCLWLLAGSALLEFPAMAAAGHGAVPAAHPGLFALAALMGFAVNVLAYATIQLASSLTLKVLGCVKNAAVIFAAMLLFGEEVTALQAVGYVVSTVAFGVYTHLKVSQIAGGGGVGGGGGGGGAAAGAGGAAAAGGGGKAQH